MNPISLASQFIRPDASRSEATSLEKPAEPSSLLNTLEERFGLSYLQRLLATAHDAGAAAPKMTSEAQPTSRTPGKLDNASKSLEAQDRLGNFEIQELMSSYNQAEALQSSVAKKQYDSQNSVIGKI